MGGIEIFGIGIPGAALLYIIIIAIKSLNREYWIRKTQAELQKAEKAYEESLAEKLKKDHSHHTYTTKKWLFFRRTV